VKLEEEEKEKRKRWEREDGRRFISVFGGSKGGSKWVGGRGIIAKAANKNANFNFS